jgi:hypothetical protein
MMDFTAENGRIITDEMFDEMAKKYEDGTWGGKLGKLVVGRPSLADEDVKSVSFRLPISKIAMMDARAAAKGKTRSEFLRSMIEEELSKSSA